MDETFYCIEYRLVKKNVETFGLLEWIEGICLYCKGDINNPEEAKVIQNLGKIQDMNNMVACKNKKGIVQTRPANMFTNMESLISRGTDKAKYHGLVDNKDLVIYNKQRGIFPQ